MSPLAREILEFWFETADLESEVTRRDIWFRSTPEFDAAILDRFASAQAQAATGDLDHFMEERASCLALIIALDQFPRNIFRGTPKAFASDAKARGVARHALARGYDKGLSTYHKIFFYLPFEHSEELADQDRAVRLYGTLDNERVLEAAVGHRDAIIRFGRFPHRNAVLGRPNTAEEIEYLKDPPLWGKTAAEVEEIERRKKAAAKK